MAFQCHDDDDDDGVDSEDDTFCWSWMYPSQLDALHLTLLSPPWWLQWAEWNIMPQVFLTETRPRSACCVQVKLVVVVVGLWESPRESRYAAIADQKDQEAIDAAKRILFCASKAVESERESDVNGMSSPNDQPMDEVEPRCDEIDVLSRVKEDIPEVRR